MLSINVATCGEIKSTIAMCKSIYVHAVADYRSYVMYRTNILLTQMSLTVGDMQVSSCGSFTLVSTVEFNVLKIMQLVLACIKPPIMCLGSLRKGHLAQVAHIRSTAGHDYVHQRPTEMQACKTSLRCRVSLVI